MKNKVAFISLVLLFSLSVCSAQVLDISIEYDSKTSRFLPVYFCIKNNTGKDIPNVEYILNDSYFYSSNLSSSGGSLNLLDFAKQDGTRYDYFSIKPLELKVKSKAGIYSVKLDDIPYEKGLPLKYSQLIEALVKAFMGYDEQYIPSCFPVSEEFKDKRDPLQYSQVIEAIRVQTRDTEPAFLMVQVAFGYPSNDKSTPQEISACKVKITDFLRAYFQNKTVAELKKEDKIKVEIRNELNKNVLKKSKIKDVRFTRYEIMEP